GFHVVGAQHDDDGIERLMARQERRQDTSSVAVGRRGEIIERRCSPAQALGYDTSLAAEARFEPGRPAVLVSMAPALDDGVGAEGEAVAEGEDGFHHPLLVQASIITGVSISFLNAASSSAPRAPSTERWSQERVTVMNWPVLTWPFSA